MRVGSSNSEVTLKETPYLHFINPSHFTPMLIHLNTFYPTCWDLCRSYCKADGVINEELIVGPPTDPFSIMAFTRLAINKHRNKHFSPSLQLLPRHI